MDLQNRTTKKIYKIDLQNRIFLSFFGDIFRKIKKIICQAFFFSTFWKISLKFSKKKPVSIRKIVRFLDFNKLDENAPKNYCDKLMKCVKINLLKNVEKEVLMYSQIENFLLSNVVTKSNLQMQYLSPILRMLISELKVHFFRCNFSHILILLWQPKKCY